MLALAKNGNNNIFDLDEVVEIEEVWKSRDREIDRADKVEWTYIEHPRNVIVDSKNYMRLYLERRRLGIENKKAEKRLKDGKKKGRKAKRLRDEELQHSIEEIRRIDEKLEYLDKKKRDKKLGTRKRKKFVQRYDYLWQYRKAVRNAGSRLKDRMVNYERTRKDIKKRQEAELNYILSNKTLGERTLEQLKGVGAKALIGLGAMLFSMPMTDEWPYWGAVGVGGTFVGHLILGRYAWTAEDKAILKYHEEFVQLNKKLEHKKAKVYVQTAFQVLNALEDSLNVNTRRKTFYDYKEEARKI